MKLRKLNKNNIGNNKILILYILLLLFFSLFLVSFINKEFDYFWHIKAGEFMVNNKTILKSDIFSWIVNGKSWMSHEWLFEVIIYSLKLVIGKFNIVVYTFINIFLLSLSFFLPNKKSYLKNIPFSLLWLSFMMILIGFVQARPHLISYNLLALTVYLSYDLYHDEDSKKVLFLPIISLIWANVHGGSSNLSYMIPFIFIFCGVFNFSFDKIESKRLSKKQFAKYFVVSIFCMLSLCINPHGIKMLFYPYQNMNDSFMLATISEWQPTNLSNLSHIPYLVLVIIIIFVYLFSRKKIRLIDFFLFGFAVFLGFKSIRFWPFVYIITTYNIFYYIGERKQDKGTDLILAFIIVMFLVMAVSNRGNVIKNVNHKVLNDKVIEYLNDNKPKRLYNYYDYGGYLIYKDIKVFVDGRADLYSEYNYRDYHYIYDLSGNCEKLIKKYKFDYFFIPKGIALDTYLRNSRDYSLVFKDRDVVIYKSND